MTTQSRSDADRTAFGRPSWWRRNFGGGDPRTDASPEALAAWEASMANYAPPGGANRRRLDDQSRTEAYDPGADMFDPRNMRPVDMQGGTLWTNDYSNMPVTPPPPATKLSSSKSITDAISKAIAGSVGDWVQPPPDDRSLWAAAGEQPPETRPPDDRSLWAATGDTSVQPPYDQLPPYVLPPSVTMPYPRGTFDRRPPVTAGAPGKPSSQPNFSNARMDAANRWLRDKLTGLGSWNGQIYAAGGPVGFAKGGMYDGDMPGMPAVDDGGYLAPTAFGTDQQIGPSHAVLPMPPPQLAPQGGAGAAGAGKKGGGIGSSIGSILGMAAGAYLGGPAGASIGSSLGGSLGGTLDSAEGGRVPLMRGGYPELYTRAQRTAFSTGGGQNYVRPDGRGNGRSDHIDASLSPGEFVMDAETVSLAGDGDNTAGGREFERLRQNIRRHKGKQLAKGKFSAKAKPLESYMSSKLSASDRAAHGGVSDGMRQVGR